MVQFFLKMKRLPLIFIFILPFVVSLILLILKFYFRNEFQFCELTEKCKEEFSQYKPTEYCRFPIPSLTDEQMKECGRSCDGKSGKCCWPKCATDQLKVYQDGNFLAENYMTSYKNYFTLMKSQNEEVWMPIVEKAFERCQEISKKIN